MQNILMNKSEQALYKVLGAELPESAVIDTKVQAAYEIIRQKSQNRHDSKDGGTAEFGKEAESTGIKKSEVKEQGNRNPIWRKVCITFGSMAAVLCVTCIFCVMNPVMAREIPILGSIFGRIADVYSFGKIPEEGTVKLSAESSTDCAGEDASDPAGLKPILAESGTDFAGENGGSVSAEGSGAVGNEEPPLKGNPDFADAAGSALQNDFVSADGGIKISIIEEYASNQAAYIGVKVENEQAFPEMAALIDSGQQFIKARTTETYSFSQAPRRNRRYIEGKFVDEHTFLGIIRIDYDDIRRAVEETEAQDGDVQIPEAFTLELEIAEIASTLKDFEIPEEFDISDEAYAQMTEEEQAAYFDSIPRAWYGIEYQSWHQTGTWHFTLPVRMTDENARTIEVGQYDKDGIGVESIEISSMEIRVNTVMPQNACLYTVVFDADGRQIETSNSSNAGFARLIDGHDISEVSVYFCDLSVYFDLEEAYHGAELTREEVDQIARYRVTVPISE